jgi:hypothetical protein
MSLSRRFQNETYENMPKKIKYMKFFYKSNR